MSMSIGKNTIQGKRLLEIKSAADRAEEAAAAKRAKAAPEAGSTP